MSRWGSGTSLPLTVLEDLNIYTYSAEDIANKVRFIWTEDKVRHGYAMRGTEPLESIDIKKFGRDWTEVINRRTKLKNA